LYAYGILNTEYGILKYMKKVPQDEKGWRKILTPEQYKVLREKGTEAPFSGKLLHADKDGTYMCSACGNPLFSSDAKFESGTGWPSFDEAIPGAVKQVADNKHGPTSLKLRRASMSRTEIVCSRCGSHLGHVFDDGPTETGKRFCLNSVCLDFDERGSQ